MCVHNCDKLVKKTEELVFVKLDSSGLYKILFSCHSDGEMSYCHSLKSLHHSPFSLTDGNSFAKRRVGSKTHPELCELCLFRRWDYCKRSLCTKIFKQSSQQC